MTFRPLMDGKKFSSWVKDLEGKSGVYVIKSKGFFGGIKYIGESHTNRLRQTLCRHFYRWKGPTAGPTFKKDEVEIAIFKSKKENAVDLQNALIAEHAPELNVEGKKWWQP